MSVSNHRPHVRAVFASLAVTAVCAAILSGCSGSPGTSGTSGGSAASDAGPAESGLAGSDVPQGDLARDSKGAAAVPAPAADAAGGSAVRSATGSAPAAPGAVAVAPKLAKSAGISLRVTDLAAAAARVRAIATGLQGSVLDESIGTGPGEDPRPLGGSDEPFGGFGTLTVSVPAARLDAALDQLSKAQVGTVLSRTMSSTDVTTQYVDTQSRLTTMRASVDRVRALMTRAKDIGQVVALESELSRREADLESLGAQLVALDGQVVRSTITVSLSTPGHEARDDHGFLAGLSSGWDAFQASVRDLLTTIGTVLPFAALLALLGFPILTWLRRRRGRRARSVPDATG